jgi:inorganic triphosphatase YgiF
MPEKDQTEENDNQARTDSAQEISPLISTDFHRCRKRNLLLCVSSVFIRG